MALVTYEARRGLVSYHASGSNYSLDFATTTVRRPNGGDLRVRSKSLSGKVETLYFGEERVWSVTTAPVQANSAQADLLLEFLRSTADGQEFSFDPYGTGESLTVVREDDGYTEEVFQEVDGVGDYVRFSFTVREI